MVFRVGMCVLTKDKRLVHQERWPSSKEIPVYWTNAFNFRAMSRAYNLTLDLSLFYKKGRLSFILPSLISDQAKKVLRYWSKTQVVWCTCTRSLYTQGLCTIFNFETNVNDLLTSCIIMHVCLQLTLRLTWTSVSMTTSL